LNFGKKTEVIDLTLVDIVSPCKRDTHNWYITFLKEKEESLILQLPCKRIKTQKKIYYSEQGKIIYPFVYVKLKDGHVVCPLREYLGLGKYRHMSQDFKNKLIMKASRTTYQKAVEDIRDSFCFSISKKTLNRYVIEDANKLDIIEEPTEEQNILIADSTKVRNGKKGHHEVMAAISLDYETNESSLTAFDINAKPKETAAKINIERYKAFVGDADLGLRNFFKDKIPFHLCHQHAINDVSFFLWKEGMKKKERDLLKRKFEASLYALKNSTKKYWKDNKTGRLVNRIIRTRRNLTNLAAEISCRGMHDAPRYIMDHRDHVLTAAKLALVGIKVPWTTNHAERLMQEIGIRTKKKGMNWTEQGLRGILNLVLKRYFLPIERRYYKEVFTNKPKEVVET
jgi:hypothetical protein